MEDLKPMAILAEPEQVARENPPPIPPDRHRCWTLGYLVGAHLMEIRDSIGERDVDGMGPIIADELNHLMQSEREGCISEFESQLHKDTMDEIFADAKKGKWKETEENFRFNYGGIE